MIQLPLTVNLTVKESQEVYSLTVESNSSSLNMEVLTPVVSSTIEDYAGPYTATATTDGAVILSTEGKRCTDNITVSQLRKQTPQNPNISVDSSTGTINTSVSFQTGYNDSFVVKTKSYPMPAQAAHTYAAGTKEKTILVKGTYLTGDIKLSAIPTYSGPTEITPTEADQIVEVKDLLPTDNITVKRVPNNYGRIEWNGSYITII